MSRPHNDVVEAMELWMDLGERERRVLLRIGRRLYMGQEQYGYLEKDKKDWTKEASEEAFDMAIYLSALLEDMKEEG